MLENLLQHSNIGSQSQIAYIVGLLSKGNCSIQDLKKACISKEYSFNSSFDGVICLLQWLSIIKIDNLVSLRSNLNLDNFIIDICNLLFIQLAKEKQLHRFLNSSNLIFEQNIYVKNSFIKLSFSPIRNFLIGLGIFENDNLIYNQFIVSKNFSTWFFEEVIPLIENSRIGKNSLASLKSKQKIQEDMGLKAERFVLSYEKIERCKHPKSNNIKIISSMDVSAGYDIKSYKNDKSVLLDKFIEVKSYSKNSLYFYWSKNEIEVAKQEQNNYFLYLVNRDKINNKDYHPLIIQYPYKNILNNKNWQKDCQKWRFENINKD